MIQLMIVSYDTIGADIRASGNVFCMSISKKAKIQSKTTTGELSGRFDPSEKYVGE